MNETLYIWTFKFHKVVRQQNSRVVEDFILPYSVVYLRIQKWKNYWIIIFMAHGVYMNFLYVLYVIVIHSLLNKIAAQVLEWRKKIKAQSKIKILVAISDRIYTTRKLSYRKDDRAMRPIYECPENFREFLTMPTAIFPEILNGLFFRLMEETWSS